MLRKSHLHLKTIVKSLLLLMLFAFPAIVFAQDGGTSTGLGTRILQIVGIIGLLLTLAGIIYGATMLRNANQANDLLLGERGRRLATLSGIFFFVSLIIVVVSFVIIGRNQSPSDIINQAAIQPSGQQSLTAKDSLILTEAIPFGLAPIQNVQVQLLFNQSVDLTGIEEQVEIQRQSDGAVITGDWEVDGTFASFTPNQTCAAPNTSLACFDANTVYEVHINLALTSTDGDRFKCSLETTAQDCFFTFTTSDVVDTEAPTIELTLPYDQTGVPFDASVLMEALAKDAAGIATIHFFANSQRVGVASIGSGEAALEFRGAANWNTSGLAQSSNHTIQAQAYDLAGLSSSSATRSIEILPLACFDEAQNEGEEGIDCGGENCRQCEGTVCSSNADCASGLCFDGLCREYPVIQSIIDPEGAVGNYITIRGQNFGDIPGTVTFLGGVGDEDNQLGVTPLCDVYWTNEEIVIEVPENAQTGPVNVTTADGLFDTSDDSKGTFIEFAITNDSRPGLCPVIPNEQIVGEPIQITGKNLGEAPGQVLFGQLQAESIDSWLPEFIADVTVPQVEPGQVALKVETEDDISNPVFFTAQPSPTLPRLASVSPNRGPTSQLITILGENFDRTFEVNFVNTQTGEEVAADGQLPDQCLLGQTSRQRAIRVPRLESGTYQVVATTDAGKSNALSFRVTQGERLPGICAIVPDNGPLGIDIAVYGEDFGNDEGGIRFSPRIDDTLISGWNERQVSSVVPPNTQTGPVQLFRPDGTLSNPFQFTVGQCSPDTCEEGFQCCSNGACQKAGTCVDSVPFCTYNWSFSTGDNLQGPPRVIEDASCRTNTQSPSPFLDTKDGCLNASISARFTHDMQDQTISRDNITLRRCNAGDTFDASTCDTVVSLSRIQTINSNQPGEGFIAVPQTRLSSDTWYQVELSTAFTATNGFNLAEPYIWSFKTQIGDGECAVDHVEVTPPTATIEQIGLNQKFNGVPTALNCNILDPEAYDWNWLSSDTGKAVLQSTSQPQVNARAIAPTEPGPPVSIIGEIPSFSAEDSGQLSILLRPPVVIDQFPNCTTACPNAVIGAKFDQPMQEDSVTSLSNVRLLSCADASCARSGLSDSGINSLRYNNVDNSIFFLPSAGILSGGTTYRVILSGNIRSSSGISLGNLNYDQDGDSVLDSYSWIFKVNDDGQLCEIDRVTVIPEFAESFIIGEEFDYFSFPVSEPDECSIDGQLLNPESFEWDWRSGDTGVGEVSTEDFVPPEGFIDPYQITESIGEGETGIRAEAQGTAGEGNFTVICGYETDADCPSPATPQTHGIGANSCCYERPAVQSFNPPDGSTDVCTTVASEVQFNQVMDRTSLASSIFLEVNNGATPCNPVEEEEAEESESTVWNGIKSLARKVRSFFIPSLNAQAENWCQVGAGITVTDNDIGSVAQVYPNEELADNTLHRIRVQGDLDISDGVTTGVKNNQGVATFGNTISTFTTGDAECSLELIEIIIDPPGEPGTRDAFFCAGRNDCPNDVSPGSEGNQHEYQAIGRDFRGFVVPSDFQWITGRDPVISLSTEEGEVVEVTAEPENGSATVTVFGEAQAPSTGFVSRTIGVEVFICENPWPSLLDFPYNDTDFGYGTFYCRDFGEPGTADDLPPLSSPIGGTNIGSFLQDNLFIVE